MSGALPWISAVIAIVAAAAGWARWHVERGRNKILHKQLELAVQQAEIVRPRPDIHIIELKATGGSSGIVEFAAYVTNRGTKPVRATVSAYIGAEKVHVRQSELELLINVPPQRVAIEVPRPRLGDLVPALHNETTLYGETLRLEVLADDHRAEETWREQIYDAETERARHEAQQRAWREGRGEETEADLRAEYLREMDERAARRPQDGG